MAVYPNVPALTGVIISRAMATKKELETFYSLEDAFDMVEIIQINNYNEWLVMEESRGRQ